MQRIQVAGWDAGLAWTNRNQSQGGTGIGVNFDDVRNPIGYLTPFPFSPEAGTTVDFQIVPTNPPPQSTTYDLVFTIEKLTD